MDYENSEIVIKNYLGLNLDILQEIINQQLQNQRRIQTINIRSLNGFTAGLIASNNTLYYVLDLTVSLLPVSSYDVETNIIDSREIDKLSINYTDNAGTTYVAAQIQNLVPFTLLDNTNSIKRGMKFSDEPKSIKLPQFLCKTLSPVVSNNNTSIQTYTVTGIYLEIILQ